MKNITLSAEERLIEAARVKARGRQTTLNAEFRAWLRRYAEADEQGQQRVQAYRELMHGLTAVSSAGARFTREEMNER